MSFLFGGGRPQPSSAEKIAAAEAEIDMVSDMYNRYTPHSICSHHGRVLTHFTVSSRPAPRSVSPTATARVTLTRASLSASTVASASSSRSTSRSPRRCRERLLASRVVLAVSACKARHFDNHHYQNHLHNLSKTSRRIIYPPPSSIRPYARTLKQEMEQKEEALELFPVHALMSSAAVPYL